MVEVEAEYLPEGLALCCPWLDLVKAWEGVFTAEDEGVAVA